MTMSSRNIQETRAEDSKRLERRRIERVLSKTKGNKRRSAAMLGLSRAEMDRRIVAHALKHLIE